MNQKNFTAYQLKWIAMLTMTVDHFGVLVLWPYAQNPTVSGVYLIARLIGRIAFPLFAFMIAEGMYRTRNAWRYWLRLLAMALLIGVSMWGLSLVGINTLSGNIFVDLSMAALAMLLLKHRNWFIKPFALLPIGYVILTSLLSHYPNYLKADYGIYGLVMMLLFYLPYTKWIVSSSMKVEQKPWQIIATEEEKRYRLAGTTLIAMNLVWYGLSFIFAQGWLPSGAFSNYLNRFVGVQTYAVMAAFLIYRYRGEKGNAPKWFQVVSYLYYPLHFIALYLLYYLTTL